MWDPMILISQLLSAGQELRVEINPPKNNKAGNNKEEDQVPDSEGHAVDPPRVPVEEEPSNYIQDCPDQAENPAKSQDDWELFEQFEFVFLLGLLEFGDCAAELYKHEVNYRCVEGYQGNTYAYSVDKPGVGDQYWSHLVDQVR